MTKRTIFIAVLLTVLGIVVVIGLVGCSDSGGGTSTPVGGDVTGSPPTEDPTANWQTFTNAEFSYSVNYPPEFEIETQANTGVLILRESANTPNSNDDYLIKVVVEENPDGLTMEEYFDGDPGGNVTNFSGIGPLTIEAHGYSALKFFPSKCLCEVVIIKRDRDFIVIHNEGIDRNNVFDIIIKSFEF